MIYTIVPLLLDFPERQRANRKVNILEMPSARFIGERVVVVLVVHTSGTFEKERPSYVLREIDRHPYVNEGREIGWDRERERG